MESLNENLDVGGGNVKLEMQDQEVKVDVCYDDYNVEEVESTNDITADEIVPMTQFSSRYANNVWNYFGMLKKNGSVTDEAHFYCILCFNDSKLKAYATNTSATNLMKHAIKYHNLLKCKLLANLNRTKKAKKPNRAAIHSLKFSEYQRLKSIPGIFRKKRKPDEKPEESIQFIEIINENGEVLYENYVEEREDAIAASNIAENHVTQSLEIDENTYNLAHGLAKMIATDNLTVESIYRPGFVNFCRTFGLLQPDEELPDQAIVNAMFAEI